MSKTSFQDLTGRRFGRLTVLGLSDYLPGGSYDIFWDCRCDCGTECVARGNSLRCGKTRSCGCLRAENARKMATELNARVRYLTIATTPDGIRHVFPSMVEAAKFCGCSVHTVHKCAKQGRPFYRKNITFQIKKGK